MRPSILGTVTCGRTGMMTVCFRNAPNLHFPVSVTARLPTVALPSCYRGFINRGTSPSIEDQASARWLLTYTENEAPSGVEARSHCATTLIGKVITDLTFSS